MHHLFTYHYAYLNTYVFYIAKYQTNYVFTSLTPPLFLSHIVWIPFQVCQLYK
jgi:hypothetical protein